MGGVSHCAQVEQGHAVPAGPVTRAHKEDGVLVMVMKMKAVDVAKQEVGSPVANQACLTSRERNRPSHEVAANKFDQQTGS